MRKHREYDLPEDLFKAFQDGLLADYEAAAIVRTSLATWTGDTPHPFDKVAAKILPMRTRRHYYIDEIKPYRGSPAQRKKSTFVTVAQLKKLLAKRDESPNAIPEVPFSLAMRGILTRYEASSLLDEIEYVATNEFPCWD